MKLKKHPVLMASLCLAITTLPLQLLGQGFQKTYIDNVRLTKHNSIVNSIDKDGSVIIAGTVLDEKDKTQTDIRIQKVDKKGTLIWQKIYDINEQDNCYHINTTKDGYILTGSIMGRDRQYPYLLRIDEDGNFIADQHFDNISPDDFLPPYSQGMSVLETTDGDFVLAGFGLYGRYNNHASANKKGFVIKLKSDLSFITGRTFTDAMAEHIIEIPGKNFVVTGTNTSGKNSSLIMQLNSSLGVTWQTSLQMGNTGGYETKGAHTVYDHAKERFFVLSNDDYGCHQYTITELDINGNIVNVLASLPSGPNQGKASDVFGYTLLEHPKNPESLMVVGYTNKGTVNQNGISIQNNNFLIVKEIDKNTGKLIWNRSYKTVAPEHVASDFPYTNGLFAALTGNLAPLVYTPVIATFSPDNALMMLTYTSNDYNAQDNFNLTLVKEDWGSGVCEIPYKVYEVLSSPYTATRTGADALIRQLDIIKDRPVMENTMSETLNCENYECSGTAQITPTSQCNPSVLGQYSGNGTPTTWMWNIDGTIYYGQNLTFGWVYQGTKTYDVTLTVTSILQNGVPCTTVKNIQIPVSCGDNNRSTSNSITGSTVYPVPFSDKTNISFDLNQNSQTKIAAYNLITGQEVSSIFQGQLKAGKHAIQWEPNKKMAAGVYVIQIETETGITSHRVILQK